MSRPTLSVIIPNYNHGRYIGRAIEAVISQSRSPDEFLILDDGSTDNSLEIIGQYASQVPYIRVLRHNSNQGVVAAASTLMQAASGDYLYAGSADDFVLPGFFEKAMAMAARYPDAGVICGKVVARDPDGRELAVYGVRRVRKAAFLSPERFVKDWFNVEVPSFSLSSATIYRRAALEEVGGWRSELAAWSDSFAILAIALKDGLCYIPQRCATWTDVPTSVSRATHSDPQVHLALMARAAALMRSQEFQSRFSRVDIDAWEQRFRRQIALSGRLWYRCVRQAIGLVARWRDR